MSYAPDAVATYPLSASQGLSHVYLNVTECANSATFKEIYHPGGQMTGSILALPENLDRRGIHIVNSGSGILALKYGMPMTSTTFMQKATAYSGFIEGLNLPDITYLGPIWIRWDNNGTLSSSVAYICEFTK